MITIEKSGSTYSITWSSDGSVDRPDLVGSGRVVEIGDGMPTLDHDANTWHGFVEGKCYEVKDIYIDGSAYAYHKYGGVCCYFKIVDGEVVEIDKSQLPKPKSDLTGSVKQIIWAEKIRDTQVPHLNKVIAHQERMVKLLQEHDTTPSATVVSRMDDLEQAKQRLHVLLTAKSAREIIDVRGI